MVKIEIKGTIVADEDKWIYEWFGVGATCPKDIHTALQEANGEDLEVEINSGGGDVIAGNEIYTALRTYRGKVNIIISGMAASAASYIATARRCEISPVGIFMIHNVSGGARGDYHAMDKESEILQTVNRAIAGAYMEKTKMSMEDLLSLMDQESWLTAEKALEYGFVDAIVKNQEEETQQTGREAGHFSGKKVAIYNATTILDRETIRKTKEMLKGAVINPENAAPEGELPVYPESVLNNKNREVESMEDETNENISTEQELAAKYPDLVQKIRDDAAREAAEAENSRLKAIDDIAGQVSEKMVQDAKYGENKMTAEALALAAFRQNGIMASTALQNLQEDIGNSEADSVETDANAGLAGDQQTEHQIKVSNLAEKLKRKRGR